MLVTFLHRCRISIISIEDSIIGASIEAIAVDYPTLAFLMDWLEIHSEFVNADRLLRILHILENQ